MHLATYLTGGLYSDDIALRAATGAILGGIRVRGSQRAGELNRAHAAMKLPAQSHTARGFF
jgi:hypothetical protein